MIFFDCSEIVRAKEVPCEHLIGTSWSRGCSSKVDWPDLGGGLTCHVAKNTTIDTADVTIKKYYKMKAIFFNSNKKILFLPIGVGEEYPYFRAYFAFSCSIKKISQANFKEMRKLAYLNLADNQIEKIHSDTFRDLENLEKLWLGKKNSE